jgi:hypothetical protein
MISFKRSLYSRILKLNDGKNENIINGPINSFYSGMNVEKNILCNTLLKEWKIL